MQQEFLIKDLTMVITDDYEKMSEYAVEVVLREVEKRPDLLVCTATGNTPTMMYDILAKQKDGDLWSNVRVIKLDEWAGVPMEDSATCEAYVQKHLIKPFNIESSRYISFNGNADNLEQEAKRIAEKIHAEGPIDLCILGMGVNGHLGFNEPSSHLERNAHVATLAETTKKHSMVEGLGYELTHGLTLGMGDIMRSKKIILLVQGSHKKETFKEFLSMKITTQFPASMLWMHPNVTVVCDKDALLESEYS